MKNFKKESEIKIDEKSKIIGLKQKMYCVPALFSNFGFDIENKRYNFEDFLNLVNSLGIGLILADSSCDFVLHSESLEWFKLTMNDAHNHAMKLELATMEVGLQNLYIDDLNVGSTKEKIIIKEKPIIRIRNKKQIRSKQPVKEKVIVEVKENGRKIAQMKKKKETPQFIKDINTVKKTYKPNNLLEKQRVRFLAQCMEPYKFSNPMRLADGNSNMTGVIRGFQNLTVKPFVFGSWQYYNIIHTGLLWCQTLISKIPSSSGLLAFNLCNYTLEKQVLTDPLAYGDGRSAFSPVVSKGSVTQTLGIPLHSAATIASFDGNCYFRQAAPAYLVDGTKYKNNSPFAFPSLPDPDYAIPFIKGATNENSDRLDIDISLAQTGSATTYSVYAVVGYGTSIAQILIVTTAPVSNARLNINTSFSTFASALAIDRLIGVSIISNTPLTPYASTTYTSINVRLLTAVNGNTWTTGSLVMPFSDFVGTISPPYESFKSAIESARTVSSSLLISDFSQVTQSNGSLTSHINATNFFPSESRLSDPDAIAQSDFAHVDRTLKGVYLAPLRVNAVENREFIPDATPWYADQPFSNTIIMAPSAAELTFRVQVTDIFEVKCRPNQQVIPLGSLAIDESQLAMLVRSLGVGLIAENPNHFVVIWNLLKRFGQAAKPYLPAIQMAADVSGNSAASRAVSLASSLLN